MITILLKEVEPITPSLFFISGLKSGFTFTMN